MAESGTPQTTELVDELLTPTGGKKIPMHPRALQNRRLLPSGAFVSKFVCWMMESETNNVGSSVDPKDASNTQLFKKTLRRMWDRAVKFNRGGGQSTDLEWTHPVSFPTLGALQGMANTPFQQLAYVLWDVFQTLLSHEGSRMQVFIDEAAIDELEDRILEVEEFIDTEIGDGSKKDGGKFNLGAGMPTMARLGRLVPTPQGGKATVSEPSTAQPPTLPADTADTD